MTFIVIEDETPDPIDVGLLGPNAVMPAADHITDLVEQFWFVRIRPIG
jgi:hypothetical protein